MAIAAATVLATCSSGSTPATQAAPQTTRAAGTAAAGTTVTGSIAMTGAYDATWGWVPGNALDPGQITLTSDKGTFGNISIKPDGSFSMGSGQVSAIGLGATGKAASVGLGIYGAVCTFTLDSDLAGAPGGSIHVKGSMTIKGDSFGNCP